MKVIFHLDLDSYFISAQRTIDKSLKGKSVVVSGKQRRSIIAAASYEAKKKGIYVPMPFYAAQRADPDVISIKPNFALYTSLSKRLFDFLHSKYSKLIEVASIDECYLDVTDIWKKYGSPYKLAQAIQNDVLKKLDLPISIGISSNKFVAKMSTSINKPFGITITKSEDFLKTFGNWPVSKFHGIGKPTANKLETIDIKTIEDLSKAKIDVLEIILGKVAYTLMAHANGKGDDQINTEHNDLKGIGNSITFQDYDKANRSDILSVLFSLCELVSLRASNRNIVGNVVTVYIKKKGGVEIRSKSKQKSLNVPIQSTRDIFNIATTIFDELWDEETIKFIGIHLTKLENMFETTYQTSIFDKEKPQSKIDSVISEINRKLKNKVVLSGKELKLNQIKKQNQSRYIESDRIIKHYDDDYK